MLHFTTSQLYLRRWTSISSIAENLDRRRKLLEWMKFFIGCYLTSQRFTSYSGRFSYTGRAHVKSTSMKSRKLPKERHGDTTGRTFSKRQLTHTWRIHLFTKIEDGQQYKDRRQAEQHLGEL